VSERAHRTATGAPLRVFLPLPRSLKYAHLDCTTVYGESDEPRWPKMLFGVQGVVKGNDLLDLADFKKMVPTIMSSSPGLVLGHVDYVLVNKVSTQCFAGQMVICWTFKGDKIQEERFFGFNEPALVKMFFSHLA
jgi:hypothetical protein